MKLGTLCYINDGSKTLMLYRNKKENDMHEGLWVGIGGKFEQGESPEDCVVREVAEESGLSIRNPQLKGVLTFAEFLRTGEDWYVFLFSADEFEGKLMENCPEGELKWVEKTELDALPMHDGDRLFLKWMDEHKFFSAKFNYDENGALTGHSLAVY